MPAVSGLRVSARDRLANSVYRKFSRDFVRRGQGAIDRVYDEDPVSYLKIATSLLPKQVDVGLSAGFGDFLRELAQLPAQPAAPLPYIEGETIADPSPGALERGTSSATPILGAAAPAPQAVPLPAPGPDAGDRYLAASLEEMLAQFLE